MNREIKFRGFSDELKQFVYGFYHEVESEGVGYSYIFWQGNTTPVRADSVVQFTGLYDKNLKEIYESDILWRYESKGAEIKTFCKIIYQEDRFIPKWITATWFNDILRNHVKELEIIEKNSLNPEMLLVSQAIT